MNKEEFIEFEKKILSRDFYMKDFLNDAEAARYLNVSIVDFEYIMRIYKTTLPDFIDTIRIEDAIVSLFTCCRQCFTKRGMNT